MRAAREQAITIGTALLLVLCSAGSVSSGHADAYTPVVASVLGPPTFPFLGTDTKYHIVYDLQFLNASTIPATLQKVEIVDAAKPSRVIISYEGGTLVDRLRTLAGPKGTVQNG